MSDDFTERIDERGTVNIAELVDPAREDDEDFDTSIIEGFTRGDTVLEAESTGKTKSAQTCE